MTAFKTADLCSRGIILFKILYQPPAKHVELHVGAPDAKSSSSGAELNCQQNLLPNLTQELPQNVKQGQESTLKSFLA